MLTILLLVLSASFQSSNAFTNVEDEIVWRTISSSESYKYYSQWQMESMHSNPFLPDHKASCNLRGRSKTCCIGSVSKGGDVNWGTTKCSGAVSDFYSIPEYKDDPTKTFRTMHDIFADILQGKYVFSTVGDSVHSQLVSALDCSWMLEENTTSTFSQRNYKRPKEVREGINSRRNVSVNIRGVLNQMYQDTSYRPDVHLEGLKQLFELSDVVLINYGLHWNWKSQHDYKHVVWKILRAGLDFVSSGNKVLIWRETSAQHHATVGGEYNGYFDGEVMKMSEEEFHGLHHRCLKKVEFDDKITRAWRDTVVREVAGGLGYIVVELGDEHVQEYVAGNKPLLYILPFFEHSLRRWDLHPAASPTSQCEPTHFCYYPYFWAPVLENLARILEIAL